jgi:DNA-binding NtrC family response regulator
VRLLHLGSTRPDSPFVHVDCTALPGDLIEAELFGHEKGAFTSAHARRIGLIEAAEDGTVFLDEIAELPLELQAKLLAVLERRQIRSVGSSRERPVQAWFIAGTNRPVEAMVEAGEFRADLFYRLKVLTLSMPALRERGDDMILLARHFIRQTARRFGLPQPDLNPDAMAAMRADPWPGNVRELDHLIERAVLLSNGESITASILMLDIRPPLSESMPAHPQAQILDEAEMIPQALEQAGGNVSQAARRLGITRTTLCATACRNTGSRQGAECLQPMLFL